MWGTKEMTKELERTQGAGKYHPTLSSPFPHNTITCQSYLPP